eukprot:CAMPEP_0197841654 /NCGR_PEP_ID=MMETSP1437-20131217/46304_1 /TAXON_ID=49252 ORGANISM="Eucampia antarctica, Strain CCMP1452" /NCGR_SAMPLE_ID=MMETSP1437 /ASSEMBLY_ACC=CAM_ASM_001096 /LENGTH=217 /DNA_ID=CAMNT_0043451445 /DNA_START=1137 /DNA_END=1787 /DNA_ORIENTATION=-
MMDSLRDSFGFLAMGALSKVLASSVTYPIQLMKSRLQQRKQGIEICTMTGEIKVVKRQYSGIMDCASKIWKREGILGFFKGCLPNAIRVAPSAAITFVDNFPETLYALARSAHAAIAGTLNQKQSLDPNIASNAMSKSILDYRPVGFAAHPPGRDIGRLGIEIDGLRHLYKEKYNNNNNNNNHPSIEDDDDDNDDDNENATQDIKNNYSNNNNNNNN